MLWSSWFQMRATDNSVICRVCFRSWPNMRSRYSMMRRMLKTPMRSKRKKMDSLLLPTTSSSNWMSIWWPNSIHWSPRLRKFSSFTTKTRADTLRQWSSVWFCSHWVFKCLMKISNNVPSISMPMARAPLPSKSSQLGSSLVRKAHLKMEVISSIASKIRHRWWATSSSRN